MDKEDGDNRWFIPVDGYFKWQKLEELTTQEETTVSNGRSNERKKERKTAS